MTDGFSVLTSLAADIGECPVWDDRESCLYWTDIPNGVLYRYDPHTGRNETAFETDPIGGFTLQRDGSTLLFGDGGRITRRQDGETTTVVAGDESTPRFNDVVADPAGGVFCGMMPDRERDGRLYRLSTDGELSLVLDGLGVPNGLDFTPDGSQLYFTESTAQQISRFDFDAESGELGKRRSFVELTDEAAYNEMSPETYPVPDGLTVDEDGYVWSVLFGGEGVVRFDPDGIEERRLTSPVKTATSLAFGGPEFRELFVTSGRIGERDVGQDDEDAGSLLSIHVEDVRGRPVRRSAVSVDEN